jgi:hypothetical protein
LIGKLLARYSILCPSLTPLIPLQTELLAAFNLAALLPVVIFDAVSILFDVNLIQYCTVLIHMLMFYGVHLHRYSVDISEIFQSFGDHLFSTISSSLELRWVKIDVNSGILAGSSSA